MKLPWQPFNSLPSTPKADTLVAILILQLISSTLNQNDNKILFIELKLKLILPLDISRDITTNYHRY